MMSTDRTTPGRAALVCVAVMALAGGCNYGSLTTWEDTSDNSWRANDESSETEEDDRSYESAVEGRVAKACVESGPPSAGDAPARLLTNYEYRQTVRDLLGYAGDVANNLPPENKVNGFENNADTHVASRLRIRKFMKGSEEISKAVVEKRFDEILPCSPSEDGEKACGHQFVRDFLPRAFRRPPTDAELQDFTDLFDKGLQQWDFRTGVQLFLQAALQSPQFLYRLKLVDGSASGETTRLSNYEMATRLSYLLWASMPDRKLLEAAKNGELETADQIEAQARRMLEDPRAKHAVYQFHRQWLHLDNFDSVVKDAEKFPKFGEEMTDDWKESMRRFVLDVYFSENGDIRRLLTSPTVYLSDRLATIYGRDDTKTTGFDRYQFDQGRRAGLLTQPSLMALLANANQSSPIRRGVWVREQLLCQTLEPPPPDLDVTPPDPDPDATTRERFREHTANPACAGCHAKIDPIGFGFAHYDAMGRWRSKDNDRSVNAEGHLAQTADPEIEGPFDGAVELADKLAESDQVRRCIAQRWFTYALGGPPSETEKCALNRVQKHFAESGGDFEELLVSIATSEAFRYRKVHDQGEPQ